MAKLDKAEQALMRASVLTHFPNVVLFVPVLVPVLVVVLVLVMTAMRASMTPLVRKTRCLLALLMLKFIRARQALVVQVVADDDWVQDM